MKNDDTTWGGLWLRAALPGWLAGTAWQLQQQALPSAAACAGGVALAVALLVASRLLARRLARRWVIWLACCAACVLLAFCVTSLRAVQFASAGLAPALEGRDIQVRGTVAALPQRSEDGVRFRFDVAGASLQGRAVRLPARVLLGWYDPDAQVVPGEQWDFTVRLKAPHGHVNPHGFDYELWLWEQGLQATGYVRNGRNDAPPRRVDAGWSRPVERARQSVRAAIWARVPDTRLAGVLAALVVGDQSAIERADWDVFRATGVAHLMSISGLHVTMFAWAAGALVGALWRRSVRLCLVLPVQHAALLGGLALAAAYAVFSGWGVPAQRTVWMLCTMAALRLSGREWPRAWLWMLAAAVVVLVDPWAMLQAGFWLSFVAVGVLFAANPAQGATPRGAGRRALALLREQAIVSVALAPLSLLLFGQLSVVGLLANLVAIPWVTLCVTPLAMAGVLLPPAWTLAAWAVDILGVGLGWLAQLSWATFSSAVPPLWMAAAALGGGVLLAMRLPAAWRVAGVSLLLPVVLWQPARPAEGVFELLAADVGQGNAVLVRTRHHTLLYDAGPRFGRDSDAGHRVLVPLLRAMGERVDVLMLSHRDVDHTGGAAAILAMQPQARLHGSLERAHPLATLRPLTPCEAGQAWEWDGVRFTVLHPRAGMVATKPNALSCVLRITSAGGTALLAGDIEAPQEAALQPGALRADLLLVPHHGSRTSSSAGFLDAVAPRLALVQAGYRNRFGHPAPDVMARYHERGIRVVQSVDCGAATWRSDSPGDLGCEREGARRYWHHGAVRAWGPVEASDD